MWVPLSQCLSLPFSVFHYRDFQTDSLQAFLVQGLSAGVMAFTHSVMNKLFTTLAIFMLKCTPDIWPNAFKELIDAWGQEQPELLLRYARPPRLLQSTLSLMSIRFRVFAEVATEYPKMGGGMRGRGVVKTELIKSRM